MKILPEMPYLLLQRGPVPAMLVTASGRTRLQTVHVGTLRPVPELMSIVRSCHLTGCEKE